MEHPEADLIARSALCSINHAFGLDFENPHQMQKKHVTPDKIERS